jgi:aminoglycoside 6'-N-acetyltransferase I
MEEFITLDQSLLSEMAELYRSAFRGDPWNDDWSDTVQLTEYLKEISGGYNALNYGLLIDGKLAAMSVGSIRHWWEGTNYNIEEFCVDPGLQGQGIGSRFMKMIENAINEKGLYGIFLQTDNDKPSYRFYMKNGFKELGAHVSFYKRVKE